MPSSGVPAADEHIDEFFDHINTAMAEWMTFEKKKPGIEAGIKTVRDNARMMLANRKDAFYTGCDIGIYSNLDAAIDDAGQVLERYMLAIHEMKAAYDKAWQASQTGGYGSAAEAAFMAKELVESVHAQAVAAQGAWEGGLKAVMPAYRKFKVASTQALAR